MERRTQHYRDVHYHFHQQNNFQIINKLNKLMSNIAELTAKVDALQVSLDAEQEQIAAAIAALSQALADAQAAVADGGTPEQRQQLADKLDSIKADLEGTIP